MTVDYTRPPNVVQPPPPPVAPPPQKSGCLKWGCIGCGTLLILCLGCAGGFAWIVLTSVKQSDAYRGAVKRAQNDPRVVAVLGSPVEPGWWLMGNIDFDGHNGEADFVLPLHGPKGSGKLEVSGSHTQEGWKYSELTFMPENGLPIDLLKP